MNSATVCTPRAGSDGGRCGSDARSCRVAGCSEPLPPGYHTKYRICRHHCQLASQEVDGETVRFCQQCGRFQGLDEFDATRRSCRASLSQHKLRRHLAKQQLAEKERNSAGAAPADEGAAEGKGKRRRQEDQQVQQEQPHPPHKAASLPRQPLPPTVLQASKLPCAVYAARPPAMHLLPQPPAGHWASTVQAPPQLPAGHWASTVQNGLPPAVPIADSKAPPPSTARPCHPQGPAMRVPPLPAPLANPQANPQAVRDAMNIMETSPSLELILASDADLGLEFGMQWGQLASCTQSHPAFEQQQQQQQAQQQAHQQQAQQQQPARQLPSRWSLAAPHSAAPARPPSSQQPEAVQPFYWAAAGSSGVRREAAAAMSSGHTSASADSTTSQMQALWQIVGTQLAGAAQPAGAHAAALVQSSTAAPHSANAQANAQASAQGRGSARTASCPPGAAPALQAFPAAPTRSISTHHRLVAACPASLSPDMCLPLGPDDRLFLQQLSASLSDGAPPLDFQPSTSVGLGGWGNGQAAQPSGARHAPSPLASGSLPTREHHPVP